MSEESELYGTWLIEVDISPQGFETSSKLASMMATRLASGSAIVVCSKPRNMLPAIKKRWHHILRLLENQRASTLGKQAKAELKALEELLAGAPFIVGQPEEVTTPCVFLLEPDDVRVIPPSVATLLIVSPLSLPQLLFWGRRLPEGCKVVIFRRGLFPSVPEGKQ